MRKSRWKAKRVALVCAMLMLLGVVGYFLPGERPLLKRATPITSTATWLNDTYGWETGRSLIFVRHDDQQDSCLLFRLDPKSQTETPLTAFNRAFGPEMVSTIDYDYSPIVLTRAMAARLGTARLQSPSYLNIPGLTFSPDGKWIAWRTLYQVNDGPNWILCTLDGKRRLPVAALRGMASEIQGLFAPDDTWVSITPAYATLSNTNLPPSSVILRRPDAPADPPITKPNTHVGADLIGVTPDHRVLTQAEPLVGGVQLRGNGTPTAFLTNMERPAEPEQTLHYYNPPERPYEAALSPDGTEFAACIFHSATVPGPVWLQRWLARLGVKPTLIAQIRVCRLNGTDMREIGHIPVNVNSPYMYTRAENPHALKWTQDGKQLSFVYHSILYAVPVD